MTLISQGTGYEQRSHALSRLMGHPYPKAGFRRITSDILGPAYSPIYITLGFRAFAMPSRQTLIILAVATAYIALFGVLFGSPLGVLGDLAYSIDLTTKSQLINSLAVFGFSCTGVAIWIAFAKPENPSSVVGVMAFLLWISASYGFMSIDCAVFNFCGRSDQDAKPACEVNYDKQGAYADCK